VPNVPITLPDLPEEKELEEYVSAHLQSSGLYIERNIIERAEEEVLELDIVVTDYESGTPQVKLLEVKSGSWGFPDIFKVRGWMDYLNLSTGAFVASRNKKNFDFISQKANQLDIRLVLIHDFAKASELLESISGSHKMNKVDIGLWRFSYWVERNLLRYLNACKRSDKEKKCFRAIEDYYLRVNSNIFFMENLVDRLLALYKEFQEHPHISAKSAHELEGDDFDDDHVQIPIDLFKRAFYAYEYNILQVTTFVEHRARLAILKNVVDYLLYKRAGDTTRTDTKRAVPCFDAQHPDRPSSLHVDIMPAHLRVPLQALSGHAYLACYPRFWQWFLWAFGGFILKDYEEKEYELLSNKSGIPLSEIPNAFKAYDILFPLQGGWFVEPKSSSVRIMQMFPVPFRGVGANYRRYLYPGTGKLSDLKLTGRHTVGDLVGWGNLLYNVLKPSGSK
jgi:hypothetical protein